MCIRDRHHTLDDVINNLELLLLGKLGFLLMKLIIEAVSYTHLDVYKRQSSGNLPSLSIILMNLIRSGAVVNNPE